MNVTRTTITTSPRSRAIQDAEGRRLLYTEIAGRLAGVERDLTDALGGVSIQVLGGQTGRIARAIVALAAVRDQLPALMPGGME